MIQSLANFLRRRQQKWNSGQMLSILAHSSLEVHCSYRLKFFVAKNHLRSSSPSNCSLLCSRCARSCSLHSSKRSRYTEGVALRMRICIAVQRLSRKCVQKKNTPWRPASRGRWRICHVMSLMCIAVHTLVYFDQLTKKKLQLENRDNLQVIFNNKESSYYSCTLCQ